MPERSNQILRNFFIRYLIIVFNSLIHYFTGGGGADVTDMHRTGMEIIDKGDAGLDEWGHSDESDDEFGSLLDENEQHHIEHPRHEQYHELDRLETVQKYLNYIAALLFLTFLGYTSASFFNDFFAKRDIHSVRSPTSMHLETTVSESSSQLGLEKHSDLQEIKRIAVIGERNSGSIELAHALSRCFPQAEVCFILLCIFIPLHIQLDNLL